MKVLSSRLRAWAYDAMMGRSIIGCDQDFREAARVLDGVAELIQATEAMISEYYYNSVGNEESAGAQAALAAIKRIKSQ